MLVNCVLCCVLFIVLGVVSVFFSFSFVCECSGSHDNVTPNKSSQKDQTSIKKGISILNSCQSLPKFVPGHRSFNALNQGKTKE